MMIAKITNVNQDYDYEVKDIVCINYVDTNIILVTEEDRHLPMDPIRLLFLF